MDLLKYLEPMKDIPERFSNLAFWRGVRKLRDEVVNALEYVDSWGENVESKLANVKNVDYTKTKYIACSYRKQPLPKSLYEVSGDCIVVRMVSGIIVPELPSDFGAVAYGTCDVSATIDNSQVRNTCQALPMFQHVGSDVRMQLNNFATYFNTSDGSIPASTTLYVDNTYLYYYPTK
jgi:hypothetical protein